MYRLDLAGKTKQEQHTLEILVNDVLGTFKYRTNKK